MFIVYQMNRLDSLINMLIACQCQCIDNLTGKTKDVCKIFIRLHAVCKYFSVSFNVRYVDKLIVVGIG